MLDFLKSALSGGVERISPDEAAALVKSGAVIIDVREPSELAQSGKAKGAINIPVGQITAQADPSSPAHDPRLNKDNPIILYCASGMRSGAAGSTLKSMGYGKVYNMGTLSAWAAAGCPVEKG